MRGDGKRGQLADDARPWNSGPPWRFELVWDELDRLCDQWMAMSPSIQRDAAHLKGRMSGLATALAIFRNPDAADRESVLAEVREEMMERWESRQPNEA